MAFDQFNSETTSNQNRYYNNKRRVILVIILAFIGVLMIGYKYIAWTYPMNHLIRDSAVYHDNSTIVGLYENDDSYVFIFENGMILDTYDKTTEIKTYNITLLQLTGSEGSDYDLILTQGGYEQVSILGYRLLGVVQIMGIVLIIISVSLYFYRDKTFTIDKYKTATAEARTKADYMNQTIKNINVYPNRGQKPPL